MNYIYNKYIIVYDTNSLFFSVKDNNEKKLKKSEKLNADENIKNNKNLIKSLWKNLNPWEIMIILKESNLMFLKIITKILLKKKVNQKNAILRIQ